jgi:isoquinoline 1-oxidoreductase subunit alpha
MMVTFTVNGRSATVDVPPDMPLLWVLRDVLDLKGTKFGCGMAQCGACTVHVNGKAVRSCVTPLSEAEGKQVTTIEGLAATGVLHKVQKAWVDNDVPQCGYCQSGMIMAVAALLKEKPKPTDADIDAAITNICRCGTFQQVREAIHMAASA